MKKLFCFFAFVFAMCSLPCFFVNTQNAKAEDTPIFSLTNDNFSSSFSDSNSAVYILEENIVLEEWTPINFGATLDGNGYTITLKTNLFAIVDTATIKNLGIIIDETYIFDTTDLINVNSNFGFLAQEARASFIENVFTKGDVEVTVKTSANVGGFIGKVFDGTIINNCYTNSSILLTQTNNSIETIVGGFLGAMENSQITNCYSVPTSTKMVEVQTTLASSGNLFAVGGFVGSAVKGAIGQISNIFCGGTITTSTAQLTKLYAGKIFGQVNDFSADNLSFCYTYNSATQNFVGHKNNAYTETNFSVLEKAKFGDMLNFAETYMLGGNLMWNYEFVWNTSSVWCKTNASSFPVLQVFENFSINIDSVTSGIFSTCSLSEWTGSDFVNIASEGTFKYGTRLKITAEINPNYAYYKVIKSIVKNSSTQTLDFDFAENNQIATYDFVVCYNTSGSFYATTENIQYKIQVISESINKGKVRYGSSVSQASITYNIVYGGEYTFVADPISSSFAFSSWAWLNSENDLLPATRGGATSTLNANRQINICFGITGTDTTKTYLTISNNSTIPFTTDTSGNITFTIQANFSENVCNLQIVSLLEKDSFNLYINGMLWLNDFNESVQVGVPIEIRIETKEGFTFKKWQTDAGVNLSRFIATTENENSTTLTLTVAEDFVLYIDITENASQNTDLTWLWAILGGLGGTGLVVLVVVLITKRVKRESFLNYY